MSEAFVALAPGLGGLRRFFSDPHGAPLWLIEIECSSFIPIWQERAKNTRELADRATSDDAKKLLFRIAEGYDRLAK